MPLKLSLPLGIALTAFVSSFAAMGCTEQEGAFNDPQQADAESKTSDEPVPFTCNFYTDQGYGDARTLKVNVKNSNNPEWYKQTLCNYVHGATYTVEGASSPVRRKGTIAPTDSITCYTHKKDGEYNWVGEILIGNPNKMEFDDPNSALPFAELKVKDVCGYWEPKR